MDTSAPLTRVPRHIAIVMDGNGRWAEQRHRPRSFGHRAGTTAVKASVEFCLRQGIDVLTLFAFSSENWQRPVSEVNALMTLFLKALDREVDELHRNNVRLNFIGDLHPFAPKLRTRMEAGMVKTATNTALRFNIAMNYGGRWDIVQAARQAAAAVARGDMSIEQITEQTLAPYFCLSSLPPPDLFIRTGGEIRISNFLLWQLAYSELYFTDVLWPDMNADHLLHIVKEYSRRERRFGQTSTQIQGAG